MSDFVSHHFECNEPIIHLIILSFETSFVPSQLKIANLIRLYTFIKKNEGMLPDNYRTISLLINLDKILETIILCTRDISFLDLHHILYDY